MRIREVQFPSRTAAPFSGNNGVFKKHYLDPQQFVPASLRPLHDKLRGFRTKLLESFTLQQQAANNEQQQFAASPDLRHRLVAAIMSAMDAHAAMSTLALDSESVRAGMLGILLDHTRLCEALRARAGGVTRRRAFTPTSW
ncbi:MAG: hypothetical protein JNK15_16645 [Planctomycetes bacterium]|nr:hypothetical protein [Planctomycetota bacterium]